jgi:hypothetical protein
MSSGRCIRHLIKHFTNDCASPWRLPWHPTELRKPLARAVSSRTTFSRQIDIGEEKYWTYPFAAEHLRGLAHEPQRVVSRVSSEVESDPSRKEENLKGRDITSDDGHSGNERPTSDSSAGAAGAWGLAGVFGLFGKRFLLFFGGKKALLGIFSVVSIKKLLFLPAWIYVMAVSSGTVSSRVLVASWCKCVHCNPWTRTEL